MKKRMFILTVLLLCMSTVNAQRVNEESVIEPLAGTWQYVEEVTKADGEKAYIGKQIYKTITKEKRYYVVLGVNIPLKEENSKETKISTLSFITQEGELEITSESTYLEYINNHYIDKNLNNTISQLRFKFGENKNILYIEYNLGGEESPNWISEVWLRVIPFGA